MKGLRRSSRRSAGLRFEAFDRLKARILTDGGRDEMRRSGREMSARESAGARSARNALCAGTTKAGRPCPGAGTVEAPDGKRYCYFHAPNISEAAKEAARERGRKHAAKARLPLKFTPAKFGDAEQTEKMLNEAADLVRAGKLPVSVANALTKIASAAAKLAEIRASEEIARLEREIAAKTRA